MILTKYQSFRPYGFRQEIFSMFFSYIISQVKHVTPGAGPLLAQGA